MKILKKVLLVVAIIIAVPLLSALFMKKDYIVERDITINKPRSEIYNYLKYLKNQDNFSVWAKIDPAMKKDYRGTDGSVGFVSSWESQNENVGQGEQEIKAMKENESIDYELRFKKPFESTAAANIQIAGLGDTQTQVKWGFSGSMPYPMNFMMPFMNMDKMLGEQLATGLKNLKSNVESQPAATMPADTTKITQQM
jgi:hypothetical protein